MNKRLLILPVSIIVFLVLLLVPMVPETITQSCPCSAIPGNAKLLPSGQYSYVTFDSPSYWLSSFGGVNDGFGQYAIIVSNLTTFGAILFVVLPLCLVASVGFVLALVTGRKNKKVPWQEVARVSRRESSSA